MASDLAGVLVVLVPVDTIKVLKCFFRRRVLPGSAGPKKTGFAFLVPFGT